jgi:hypothetical protein
MTHGKAAQEATKLADKADKEVTLANVQPAKTVAGQRFSGTCFNCGKQGHKADECRGAKQGNGMNYAPNHMKGGRNNNNKNKTGGSSEPRKCTFCGKNGHTADKCWLKPGNEVPASGVAALQKQLQAASIQADKPKAGSQQQHETMLCQFTVEKTANKLSFPKMIELLSDPNVFVADSGSSAHSTGHKHGFKNLDTKDLGAPFVQPNGSEVVPSGRGDLPVTVCDQHGNALQDVILADVKYIKGQHFNLISTTKLQRDGWIPGGNETASWFTKGDERIKFDIMIPTADGCIFAVYLERRDVELAMAHVPKLTLNQAHQRLGHHNEDLTRQIAKSLGIELQKGSLDKCESCAIAKARQKNVTKNSDHDFPSLPNERVYLDQALVKKKKNMPVPTMPNWCIIVDERTQLKFSSFHEKKNGMVEPVCVQFDQW